MFVFDVPRLVRMAGCRAADGHGQEDTSFDSRVLPRFSLMQPLGRGARRGSRTGWSRERGWRHLMLRSKCNAGPAVPRTGTVGTSNPCQSTCVHSHGFSNVNNVRGAENGHNFLTWRLWLFCGWLFWFVVWLVVWLVVWVLFGWLVGWLVRVVAVRATALNNRSRFLTDGNQELQAFCVRLLMSIPSPDFNCPNRGPLSLVHLCEEVGVAGANLIRQEV